MKRPYMHDVDGRFSYGDKRPLDTSLLDAWDDLHPSEPAPLSEELRAPHANAGGDWIAYMRGERGR